MFHNFFSARTYELQCSLSVTFPTLRISFPEPFRKKFLFLSLFATIFFEVYCTFFLASRRIYKMQFAKNWRRQRQFVPNKN